MPRPSRRLDDVLRGRARLRGLLPVQPLGLFVQCAASGRGPLPGEELGADAEGSPFRGWRLSFRGSKLGYERAGADRTCLRLGRKPSRHRRFLRARQNGLSRSAGFPNIWTSRFSGSFLNSRRWLEQPAINRDRLKAEKLINSKVLEQLIR